MKDLIKRRDELLDLRERGCAVSYDEIKRLDVAIQNARAALKAKEAPENLKMADPIEAAVLAWFEGYKEYVPVLAAFRKQGVPASFRRQMQAVIAAYHEASGTVAVPVEKINTIEQARDAVVPLVNDRPIEFMRLLHAIGAGYGAP